jgi:hypothetical protein
VPGDQETIRLIDLPQNKEDIAQLITALEKLDAAAKGVSGISIFGKTGNAAEARQQQTQMAAGMEQITQLQQKMIELENQLAAAKQKSGAGGKAKTDEEIRAQIEAAEARRKNVSSIKDQIKYDEAEIDSIVRKRIELKQLKAEYVNLSPENKALEAGKAMLTQMKELNDELLKQEKGYGQFGRNVGNYSEALKTLEEEFKKVTSAMSQMEAKGSNVQNFGARTVIQGFGANQHQNQGPTALAGGGGVSVSVLNEDAEAYAKLSQQAGYLNTIIQKNEVGFSSVTQQIRSNEKALQSLSAAGLGGTEAFAQLREETVESAREMKEFQRQQKLLESEAPALKALTLAAKGLGGAYAIGAGGAALFSDGNEKVEKEMNKLIAIMTILQGIQEAWELIQMKGAASMAFRATATEAATVATELFAAMTGEATAAMTALDAAMIASGIGALLIALGGLIYLLSKATESTKEYYEAQEKLNEQLKEYYDAIVKVNESLDEELTRQDEIAKKKIEIQEINARSIQDELNLNAAKKKAAEEDLARNKSVMESLRKEQEFKEYAGKSDADMQDDLKGQYDEKLSAIKKTQEALKENMEQQEKNKQFGDGPDPMVEEDIKNQKRYISDYQKQADAIKVKLDRVTKLNDAIDDDTQAIKRQNAEDEKFAHELYERKVKALTEISNILRAQSADMLALQTRSAAPEASQVQALKAEQALREQIIISNREQELRAENRTKDERQLIREKANKELFDLDVDFIGREAVIRYNALQQDVNDENMTQEELLKMREKFFQRQEEQAKNAAENRKAYLDIQRDSELKGLLQTHESRNPTGKNEDELRKYNERKLEIETEYNNKILQTDEDLNRKQIALNKVKIDELQSKTGGTSEQKQQRQKEIDDLNKQNNSLAGKNANIELQIEQNTAALKQKVAQDTLEKKIQAIDKAVEYEQQAQKTVSAFIQGAYERQLQMIDRQIQKNNELKETETARVTNSTLSETQRAAALTRIALETDAKNQALERKKHQTQIKEAEFNRDEGILNVGVNTAAAIMKAVFLSPETGGLPWSGIAAAMGAAQIAAILAKPIPKFETGTDFSPEGLAIVHPGEMRIDPSGKISMTPDAPAMTYLDRGTKIIPRHKADQMNDILLASIFSDGRPVQDNRLYDEVRGVRESNIQLGRDIVAAIKKQKAPETHVHVDSQFLTYIKTCL